MEAMELFNRFLAIEATNLILKLKATGGLYISGGIPPKILPLLKPDVWAETFENSGRMRALLAQVTVSVLLNQKAPLLGSAYYAALNMD
jgi:glucokinase